MRLVSLSVENYKGFVDEAAVELRPLTLLFGYNSAGKSSIVRLLPILAASSEPAQPDPLAMDSEAARGASFRDLLSRQSSSPTLRIGLGWSSDVGPAPEISYFIRDLADRQYQVVEKVQFGSASSQIQPFTALWDVKAADPFAKTRQYEFQIGETTLGTFPIAFQGLVFGSPAGQPFSGAANAAVEQVLKLSSRVHWLNSLRAVPPRASRFGARPRRMSPDGSNAGSYLAHDIIGSGALLRDTSMWFERITGRQLGILRYSAAGEEQYSIFVTPSDAPSLEVPLVDTGEGMAQVLPVIVLGCLAGLGQIQEGSILAIEHPELHLHPAAHANLAAFFCNLVSTTLKPMVVIETHSENLLLRIQIAIARGEISTSDVVVHWIRALEDGRSVVDTITFDEEARPKGSAWPPGVFREDTEQARTLVELRRQRLL